MKFRKSPHWTEKSLRHAQKPATPRSANPCGPESTSVTPGKDPPMATPPQGRKMAPERPFPILIETGKSYSKTGLLPAVFGGFPTVLPVVSRRLSGGFPGSFPAVSRRFSRQVRRRFSSGFPPFSGGSTAVFRQVRRRLDNSFPATRFPWINPHPAPASPFIRKKLSGNSVHTFKPTNPAYGKRKVSAGTWSPGKKRCRQEPNAPGGSSGGPDSRPGCLGGHIPRNVSNRPFWTERCGLCVA